MLKLNSQADVRGALEKHLPQAALLCGPSSIGKWTLSQHLAEHHQVAPIDHFSSEKPLTIGLARDLIQFAQTMPFEGAFKLVRLRLRGASENSLNALLKTLEEPPESLKFLLVSEWPLLRTVISRCEVYRVPRLTNEEVAMILVESHGFSLEAAQRSVLLSGGRVDQALQVEKLNTFRPSVLALARSLALRDERLFRRALANWKEGAETLLDLWFAEVGSNRWRFFSVDEAFGFDQRLAEVYAMMKAVNRLSNARSRLAVQAALEPFLSRD